ncbi:ribonuclease E/G [Magnetospirillum gryphiswaldense]|uniref:ribonuclease E/G n=1 Tax=Magnetospirillum gryphiswaldense TaxID=55518 RepID=UPI000D043CE4|nr:ribonuclease E/G [Magnetospirillum gryphiswaldense]AVM73232.1 Ribonuclease E [Magnetospirillum gryphiswaldense MSR-1]AVM77135.1 Ribonuclease E [Magnetospirillum gryphiswaldense]
MVKRMLIDATHPEETRVVVVNGTRLEELDVETSTKKQLKGNIYLAKVVRVEPSLQAAFVDYGGNRHGFLAFSEIHPDYFQIPVADRQALLAAQKAEAMRESSQDSDDDGAEDGNAEGESQSDAGGEAAESDAAPTENGDEAPPKTVETVGGADEVSEQEQERRRARLLRNYKIQEVIKRRQIMLVQVVKEERGNKGAALTTYLSLAGRYCVLMPNTARGGGVSRKITSATDRRRLKAIASELDCPEGMAVIVRTAGSERSKTEIKRDYEYLLRAWDSVRDLTLKSSAPSLVYEEASLIKRSIRDLYARDIDEVLVDGDEGYRLAKDYMRMLTPSHAKKVQPYKDPVMPMFHRYQVESQLDAMHSPIVQLRSGGYIVISQTEALVAIDVNSGRSTKERHIEETAFKTNVEAAEEIARQMRLRDLAGLVVIDFIDMEENRNNHAVERRLKDALKNDRARIQVGKISAFGLLELSRQRLRPSLQETTFSPCPHCAGTGLVRAVESSAVHVLRAIEEEGIRRRSAEVTVYVPSQIALYILNQKRDALAAIEERYQFRVYLLGDDELIAPNLRMERVKAENRPEEPRPIPVQDIPLSVPEEDEEAEEEAAEEEVVVEAGEAAADRDGDTDGEGRKRRRRRRRRRKGGEQGADQNAGGEEDGAEADAEGEGEGIESPEGEASAEDGDEDGDSDRVEGETDEERRKRRRGRRGGRRRRRNRDGSEAPQAEEGSVPDVSLISNPDAVADVFAMAEAAAEAEAEARANPAPAQEATATEGEEKPKRSRGRARTKPEGEEATAETGDEAGEKPKRRSRAKAKPESEETAPEQGGETEEKPKRRTRAKAEPSGTADAEAAVKKPRSRTKAKAEDKPVTEEPALAAEPVPAPQQAEQAVAEPVIEAAAEPVAPNPVPAQAIEEAPAPAVPARRGWWNKLVD